jgi:uncharacterized surface protein with fasciclin (FAS1) repeats
MNGKAKPSAARPRPAVRGDDAASSPYRVAPVPASDIVATAAALRPLRMLSDLLDTAGLAELLTGRGPFTLFAPTDGAFARIPPAALEALRRDPAELKRRLGYHVVAHQVKAPRAGVPRSAKTVQGSDLTITAQDGGFRVNTANIVKSEIIASNGVIHAIDRVLTPG